MKVKMKFDKKAALGLVVQYGERAVFACVVLCFLFFVYQSFAKERYEKTPQDLKNAAGNASAAIERTEPDPDGPDGHEGKTPLERIDELCDPKEASYVTNIPLDSPIFTPRSKRGEPVLYTVEAVRGTPGVGRFEQLSRGGVGGGIGRGGIAATDREGEPRGSRWVMLTGLVNLKKQTEAYFECYKDVVYKRPETDNAPRYLGFWVERAEVRDSESAEDLQWKRPYKSFKKEKQKCAGNGAIGTSDGYVDPYYTQYNTAFPLPKRIDQEWDESVAYPPEIPLLSFDDKSKNEQPAEEEDDFEEDPDGFGVDLGRRRTGRGIGMESGMGGEMGMGGGMAGAGRRGRSTRKTDEKERSPYILFRFIDFNVEPGKQYKYRVRLGLADPNLNVEPRFLIPELQKLIADAKNPTSGTTRRRPYIKSPWSESSDVVAVPRDDQLLLATVTPARREGAEPEAKVMAVHWDMQNGIQVSDDFENIHRGMVANFLDHEITMPERATQPGMGDFGGHGMEMGGMLGGGPRGGRPAAGGGRMLGVGDTSPETVDFKTECLVLDIHGGRRLSRRNRDLTGPGEILFLDPDGNLVVRNDVSDFDQYRKHKFPPKQNLRMPGRRGGMGVGEPGMGEPGMGPPGMGLPGMM